MSRPAPGIVARVLFRATLLLYPKAFRRAFADRMAETLADRYAEQARVGLWAVNLFLLRFVFDGTLAAFRERLRPSIRRPRTEALTRDPFMIRLFDALRLDLRYAFRTLIRRPGFTATAVATLAIGIGGNTAIFSLVNGVLLSPLPYEDPDGLITVSVRASSPGGRPGSMSYPDIADIAEQSPSIQTLVGLSHMTGTITELGDPFVLDVTRVTEGLLASFHETPLMGRDIRADEFGANGPLVALINHSMWQERFGARSDIVGRPLMLNGISYEIIGVAPMSFDFPAETQVWIPRRLDLEGCGRGCHTMTTVGRLAPGATTEMARTEAAAIASALDSSYPDTNTDRVFLVRSLKGNRRRECRAGTLDPAGGGGTGVVHRMCERSEPATGTSIGTHRRNRRAYGARCIVRATGRPGHR